MLWGTARVWQQSATGGELGYAVFPAHGVAFDNLDLIVACVVGDREVETGALAIA
jgi:xylulose-5-phosphate/fructose-6-phosphate phosphoketolase